MKQETKGRIGDAAIMIFDVLFAFFSFIICKELATTLANHYAGDVAVMMTCPVILICFIIFSWIGDIVHDRQEKRRDFKKACRNAAKDLHLAENKGIYHIDDIIAYFEKFGIKNIEELNEFVKEVLK